MSNKYAALVQSKARQYGIDPIVFGKLIGTESNYSESAVSPKGAQGLGQLMPETARELGVNPNDPVQNVDGAARYLRQQLDRFGSYPLALAAYNAGPEAVAKYKGIPPYKETRAYVMKILGSGNNNVPEQSRTRSIIKNFDPLFGSSVAEAAEIPKPQINADKLFGGDVSGEPTSEKPSGFDWGNVGTKPSGSVTETRAEPQSAPNISGNMVKKPIPKEQGFDWGMVGSSPSSTPTETQDPNAPQWTRDYPRTYNAAKGVWELVGPTVDALAATGGAAIGTAAGMPAGPLAAGVGGVLGAGMGYSSAQHMKDIGAEALGFTPVKDVPERIAQSASDVASGAAMEMGGQIVGKAVGSAAGFLRKHYPFGKEAVKNRAGEILRENASPTSIISQNEEKLPPDSYYSRNLAKADQVEREVPGLILSVGAKTDDPGLIKLQRGLEVRGGDAAYLMKEAQAKNHQAVKSYLAKYFPEAQNLDDVTDALVGIKSNIDSKAKTASDFVTRRTMELNPLDEQRTGRAIVDEIQATKAPLKAEERRLWKEVPNYPIPTTNTTKAFTEAATKPSTSIDKVKTLRAVYEATPKTSEGLHVIEQEVNSAMYGSTATDTDRKVLGAIKQAIREDFEMMGKAADAGDVALSNGSIVYPSQLKAELDTVTQRIGQETSKLQVTPDKDAIIAALREKKIPSMRQVQEEESSFINRISEAFKRAYPDRDLPTMGGAGSGQSPELESLLKRKTNLENVLSNIEPAENVAKAYSAAKNYTKDVIVPKFKTGATKDVLRRGTEISGLKMPYEDVPKQFWTPGGADDLIRAIGDDEAKALMDTYAANEILKSSGGGELSAKRLQSWVMKHKPVLDKYGLTDKYSSLANAQSSVDALRAQQEEFSKSVFAKMIDADPREAIKTAFGGTKNTAKVAMDIMNKIKGNPKAVTGFQNAFKDFMYQQAETTAETIGRDSVLSPASLIKQLKRYDPAMKIIYKDTPEKMKAIQTVRDSFEITSRSGRPVGSGSDTAEKLSVTGSIFNEAFSHLPGASMVVKLANLAKAAQRKVTQNDVNNLVARALYDPDLAMDLIKISKKKFSREYAVNRMAYYLTIGTASQAIDE